MSETSLIILCSRFVGKCISWAHTQWIHVLHWAWELVFGNSSVSHINKVWRGTAAENAWGSIKNWPCMAIQLFTEISFQKLFTFWWDFMYGTYLASILRQEKTGTCQIYMPSLYSMQNCWNLGNAQAYEVQPLPSGFMFYVHICNW